MAKTLRAENFLHLLHSTICACALCNHYSLLNLIARLSLPNGVMGYKHVSSTTSTDFVALLNSYPLSSFVEIHQVG